MPPRHAASTVAAAGDLSPPCRVDFRATDDDAWYGVNLRVEEGEEGEEYYLRVMFCDFPDVCDERFRAGAIGRGGDREREVEGFRGRFRPSATQLQDSECRRVIEGMMVCASHVFGESDLRFYDAIVDAVCFSEHKIVEGEDVCKCTFVLLWLHGPNAGNRTSAGIENICFLEGSAQVDPALDLFLELSKQKSESARQGSCKVSECPHDPITVEDDPDGSDNELLVRYPVKLSSCKVSACSSGAHESIIVEDDLDGSDSSLLEAGSPQQFDNTEQRFEGERCSYRQNLGQDRDLGGDYDSKKYIHLKHSHHSIWIENLEKDISAPNIVDFVYQKTSIISQVYVFPRVLSESYTRGTIFLETKSDRDKLLYFLHNSAHIVVSSRGRPWVIIERKWIHGSAAELIVNSEKQPCTKVEDYSNKIKVVCEGTEEYARAKRLQDLFTEFHEHVQRLHQRLEAEEKILMQSSPSAD